MKRNTLPVLPLCVCGRVAVSKDFFCIDCSFAPGCIKKKGENGRQERLGSFYDTDGSILCKNNGQL